MHIKDSKRKWSLNGKPRRAKDIRGHLPSVAFTPDDLRLAKGPDSIRRRELDQLGSQLNSNYSQIIKDYAKILAHRNRLLKDGCTDAMLDSVDEVFSIVADQYSHYREALFDRLVPLHSARYSDLVRRTVVSGVQSDDGRTSIDGQDRHIPEGPEVLSGMYIRSWEGDIREAVRTARAQEAAHRRTMVGPHLDKVSYSIDGMDVGAFASQGQQRSVVLALKLAEVDLLEDMTGNSPLLLLDDVMSELDTSRREALVDVVSSGPQTIMTTANLDYFDDSMLRQAEIVDLGESV